MTSLDNTIPTRPLPQLKERRLTDACRPEAQALLQEIYGYADFRELEVSDDLFRVEDTIRISHGHLL